MKTIWMLWMSVLMLGVATAGELPEVYKPYEKLLGTWEGECVMQVTVDGEKQEAFTYKCTERYYFDEKLGVIKLEHTSDNKGVKMLFYSVIGWDKGDEVFKEMMWVKGEMASLYLTTFKQGVFTSRSVGGKEGSESSYTGSMDVDGVRRVKGVIKASGSVEVVAKMDFTLKKVKP
ncbi:hypothetical protein [Rubritalea halochordaticola]